MLQLRNAECVCAWIHPGEGRQCGGVTLQATLRRPEQSEGHELGARELEALDLRQAASTLAGEGERQPFPPFSL